MYATQTPNLLSDALERAYSRSLLDATQQPLQLGKAVRGLGRALGRGAAATGRFIASVINAQAEARARDMRYSRTPW
ncbi:putative protein OS=Castellaniella defragrans (strain DSM / CCUG 39792 / 65Phen) OX=1437824 GN=BN940_18066 PE=4 SV=1 [Castellaniella denitrificans]|uniref:hypothetical protein n=1 Tax=Castellaniella sp. TaxID=1955812 RepID=UPI002AFE4759|nr:hypothetical protein [Castellaniella sp.]